MTLSQQTMQNALSSGSASFGIDVDKTGAVGAVTETMNRHANATNGEKKLPLMGTGRDCVRFV